MAKVKMKISGYIKTVNAPQQTFSWEVPNIKRWQHIQDMYVLAGFTIKAAWFNVFHDGIKVKSIRLV